MLDLKDETFAGTFPFRPRYHGANYCHMHYVDEGSGEPTVFLHGDPTWGYLWRHALFALRDTHRCIVPDHMGMGKSDVPLDPYPYRLHHHISNLESLLLSLDLDGLTLVLHDWGGPVGLGFAVRHPERIKRLVLMNTWAFAPWPAGRLPRLFEIIRSSRGEKFALERNAYVELALGGTTVHTEHFTGTVRDAYLAPFPTSESRLALLSWTRDIPLTESDSSYAEMKRIEEGLPRFRDRPVCLIWGMRDAVLTPEVLALWQSVFPQADTCPIDDASHFLQEDAPERMVDALCGFLNVRSVSYGA